VNALLQAATTEAGAPTGAIEKGVAAVQQKVDAVTDKVSINENLYAYAIPALVDFCKYLHSAHPAAVYIALQLQHCSEHDKNCTVSAAYATFRLFFVCQKSPY
jgi:hypothetical protein